MKYLNAIQNILQIRNLGCLDANMLCFDCEICQVRAYIDFLLHIRQCIK